VDALPPRMANDMPTMRADAWKVGISRHQKVDLRISLQSLESPWQVRFPPSLVNGRHRHTCRSERYAHRLQRSSIMRGEFEMNVWGRT
jgi:hypothetical protein